MKVRVTCAGAACGHGAQRRSHAVERWPVQRLAGVLIGEERAGRVGVRGVDGEVVLHALVDPRGRSAAGGGRVVERIVPGQICVGGGLHGLPVVGPDSGCRRQSGLRGAQVRGQPDAVRRAVRDDRGERKRRGIERRGLRGGRRRDYDALLDSDAFVVAGMGDQVSAPIRIALSNSPRKPSIDFSRMTEGGRPD